MTAETPKVLIVDDEPTNIQVLHGVLEQDGYDISFASNGSDALAQAAINPPDIVLLDVMMPDMDGYEVCRRLKDSPATSHIPVVFVSALNQMEDEERGLTIGAIDYITKPLGPAIVRARVRNHLRLKFYQDRLEQMAMFDGLTGIANRRRFDDFLDREWKRTQRNGTPLSLILMDIDFFKPFNDNYGHAAGDDCLKKVAAALSSVVSRPADLVARYGGEEFVCVLPETDSYGAKQMGERLLEAVRAAAIPHEYSKAAKMVTLSLGCVTVTGGDAHAPSDIIEMADALLYKAKEGGRNRVVAQG